MNFRNELLETEIKANLPAVEIYNPREFRNHLRDTLTLAEGLSQLGLNTDHDAILGLLQPTFGIPSSELPGILDHAKRYILDYPHIPSELALRHAVEIGSHLNSDNDAFINRATLGVSTKELHEVSPDTAVEYINKGLIPKSLRTRPFIPLSPLSLISTPIAVKELGTTSTMLRGVMQQVSFIYIDHDHHNRKSKYLPRRSEFLSVVYAWDPPSKRILNALLTQFSQNRKIRKLDEKAEVGKQSRTNAKRIPRELNLDDLEY